MSRSETGERGIALLIVLLALSLLMALGLAVTSVTMTETAIAGGYADASQAFYAAESAVEYALQALARETDWPAVFSGQTHASFTDSAVLSIVAGEAGGGRLYAYGWLADLMPPEGAVPPLAVAAWVARDETLSQAVVITGGAYGAGGSRRVIEVRAERALPPDAPLRVVSWREVE